MRTNKTTVFTRLDDGTSLVKEDDGAFTPACSETDHPSLASLTDAEIEAMASTDPDHPALDDAFWIAVATPSLSKEAISIKLDADILSYFRLQGRGYQTRINAVLRHYVNAQRKPR